MSALHDSPFAGHVGINKTKHLVSRYYWWPSMDADVTQYVQQCHSCQTVKARQRKPSGALIPLELPMVPWECITLDFITQLPVSDKGFDAIMVVVDKVTKMVHIIPTTTTCTALQVAELYRDHAIAQRRGRVARAPAHIAVSSAGKTGPTVSQKRRTRRHSRAARAHVTRPMD